MKQVTNLKENVSSQAHICMHFYAGVRFIHRTETFDCFVTPIKTESLSIEGLNKLPQGLRAKDDKQPRRRSQKSHSEYAKKVK